MKTFFYLSIIFIASLQLQAQVSKSQNLFNSFQKVKGDSTKIDLALSYAQRFSRSTDAKGASEHFYFLIHDFFAQDFISKAIRKDFDNTTQRKLLEKMVNDTNLVVAQSVKPIYLWVQVQENENSLAELIQLTNTFMDTQLKVSNLHNNRVARYALLIYQLIHNKRECTESAQKLLHTTIIQLNKGLNLYALPGDGNHNLKRAWFRYLYAYSNFLQAEKAKTKGTIDDARKFYSIASDYSPDALDLQSKNGYDYEVVFLGTNKPDGFKEDYLAFLEANPDKSETLKALTQLAITAPINLAKLKAFYTTNYPDKESFELYWEKEFNKNLQEAPSFSLKQINTQLFSLSAYKGKWILIDFWGTWCAPCIEEMPQMQSFYREVVSKYPDKILMLAVACKDTEMKVKTFLNKHKYNFPVAMSDTKIEIDYAVNEYPTKMLITPQGNILIIPFGENWVEKVKLYCQL